MAIKTSGITLKRSERIETKENADINVKNARAVIYARTSKSGENDSYLQQVNICCDFIKQKGWTLCDIFFDECSDRPGIDRSELSNMLFNASKGCFDVVVLSSKDRLSRLAYDISKIEKILFDLRVQVFSLAETDNL